MYVTLEQKRSDHWLASIRLEAEGSWRAFQATGTSRMGALIALRSAMSRYHGPEYDEARTAVVSAAVQMPA